MSLGDTARNLREQTESAELRRLRAMRAYVAENADEKLVADMAEVERRGKEREYQSAAGQEQIYREVMEVLERGAIAYLYQLVLRYAEKCERQEKGGGAAFYARQRERIERKERGIRAWYRRKKEVQVSLEEESQLYSGAQSSEGIFCQTKQKT